MLSREALLVIGVVFHVVYLFSIFDIYFMSPLVHGMKHHKSPLPPPAQRVVLIVGDGLRADKLFELEQDGTSRAPYLRQIIQQRGAWGVSHTRVPTESRPGHVAIIAGFYEDVSAVTTGWTMNPVEFDSVFNQSRHTWSFGSPDILPMFSEGASDRERVETFMYPPEYEDFSGDASHLDTWVFDHVKALFRNASSNAALDKQLRQDKVVFFLHLLGLDTNGHTHRPYSQTYYDNIRLVDRGVKEIEALMRDFYGDDKTSFVFTADHGMNNRGGHGDGHPDNTRTPLIAWGAGIRHPIASSLGHDEFSHPWHLSNVQRNDVLQADIAPLMSHLVGLAYPANSVGRLPLDYLDADEYTKAEAAFANARGILAQYEMKHAEKERDELFFRSFAPLSGTHAPSAFLNTIQLAIDAQDYAKAEALSQQLMDLSLQGLRYFQTYDWLFLRSVITAGFIGWCAFCLEFVLRHYCVARAVPGCPSGKANAIHALAFFVFVMLAGMIWIQKMRPLYYAYVFFPVFFWHQVVLNGATYSLVLGRVRQHGYLAMAAALIGTLVVMEALVYSFFHREILSVLFIVLSLWPVILRGELKRNRKPLLAMWTLTCWATSVFTQLPVEKEADIMLVVYGGFIGLILGGGMIVYLTQQSRINSHEILVLAIQLLANAISIALVYSTAMSNERLPVFNQVANWIMLGTASVFPFVYRGKREQDYLTRLLTICLAFAPMMTLLSISYEMLFYVCLCSCLLVWLEMERALYKAALATEPASDASDRQLQVQDLRLVVLFVFFVNVAFFGTGNVASLSSFTLESVYRLVTVFNPFLMGALLITKVLIPFFIISSVYGVLTTSVALPSFSLFLGVMAINDIMTVNFFFFVSDYGSWLEIGTSISHYCIASLFIIFTMLLFLLSRWLVGHLAHVRVTSPMKRD